MSLRRLQHLVLTSPRILHLLLQMVSVPSKLLGCGLPEGRVYSILWLLQGGPAKKGYHIYIAVQNGYERVRGWTSGWSHSIYMYHFYNPK